MPYATPYEETDVTDVDQHDGLHQETSNLSSIVHEPELESQADICQCRTDQRGAFEEARKPA